MGTDETHLSRQDIAMNSVHETSPPINIITRAQVKVRDNAGQVTPDCPDNKNSRKETDVSPKTPNTPIMGKNGDVSGDRMTPTLDK